MTKILKYVPIIGQQYRDWTVISDEIFKKSTNSASILLANSFKKPIIAPLLGNIKDISKDAGYFYKSEDDIKNNILFAINHPEDVKQKSEASYIYAKSLSWKKAAEQTMDLYKN